MKKMGIVGLVVLSMVVSNVAFAAKFYEVPKLGSLESLRVSFNTVCGTLAETNLNCGTRAFQIVSKNPSEKWENTVQQILRSNTYVEDASGARVAKRDSRVSNAFLAVMKAAGYDLRRASRETSDALELALERIDNDVLDEPAVVAVSGELSGAFSLDETYLALIDTERGEVLIVSGGYAE